MATKFVPSPMLAPILFGMMGRILKKVADDIAAEARATAPVDEGEYRDSISSELTRDGIKPKGRAFATDFKAGWLEWGTSDTPKFAIFRKAAERAKL